MSESEIFQAKIDKLMTSGANTYAQIDQVALSNANDWKFKFVDLLKYDNGKRCTGYNKSKYLLQEKWIQTETG